MCSCQDDMSHKNANRFITLKLKITRDLLKNMGSRMSKAAVPQVHRSRHSGKERLMWSKLEWIEVAGAIIVDLHCLRLKILDGETNRVKFK